jgi:hypothetical protein
VIPVTVSILSAALLLFILFRVWKSACLPEPELPFDSDDADEWAACPREIVLSIFSSDDSEYVSQFNSPQLEHAQIARRSNDLEISAELGLFLRYISLQAACVFLQLSIGLVGPARVRHLSEYVYTLSTRLSYAHWALKDAMESRELQGMWQG